MTDELQGSDAIDATDATDATDASPAIDASRAMGASAGETPVQTERVRAMTTPRSRNGSRTRWAIASIVTVAVLLISTAGFMMLSAGAATSTLVGYVPAGSVGYLEIRLDAPGDQRQNAANLLSHFPGFADQSTLGTKLDEALDQLVRTASSDKQTFTGNVKAWLGDSVAMVTTRLPAMTARVAAGTSAHPKAGLLLVSVKDPAAARTWADTTFGSTTSSETYGGVALTSVEKRGMTLTYGVAANVLLMGDPQSVHDAIDTKGTGGFADTASFKAAAAAVPGDRLAFGFLDLRQIASAVQAVRPMASTATAMTLDALPAWVAVSVRAESDALSATIALPDTNLAPVTSNHSSTLAARLPATTVVAAEIHDLAAVLSTLTTSLRQAPGTAGGGNQIDQALQALGGLDSLVGWMGDASVAVVETDGPVEYAYGAVIGAKDPAAAETKLLQIKNLASLAGASAGVTVSEESYNGTAITIVDVAALTGGGRAANVPSQIAIAQKGDLVIVGLGDDFVKAVLDTKPGASLADQTAYKDAIERAGASNTGQLYMDLHEVIDLVASRLPAAEQRRYQADIKPYLDPFRALAASGSAGDPNRARVVVTVK